MAKSYNDTKMIKNLYHILQRNFYIRILPNLIFVWKSSKNSQLSSKKKKRRNFQIKYLKNFFFQNLTFSLQMFEIKIRIYHVWTERKKKKKKIFVRTKKKKRKIVDARFFPPPPSNQLSDRVYSSSPEQRCQCTSSGCTTCAVRRRRYGKSGRKENRAKADNVGPIRTNLNQQPDPCTAATRCTGARAGSLSVLRCSPAIPSMKSLFRYQGNVPQIVSWICGLSFLLFLAGSVVRW